MNNRTDMDALVDGIALALVFNGVFGLAIRADLNWLCGLLILAGVALRLVYRLVKAWRNHG